MLHWSYIRKWWPASWNWIASPAPSQTETNPSATPLRPSRITKNGTISQTAMPQSALEGFCLDCPGVQGTGNLLWMGACVRPNIIMKYNESLISSIQNNRLHLIFTFPGPSQRWRSCNGWGANLYSTWLQAEVGSAELYIKLIRTKPQGFFDGCFVLWSRWCSIPKTVAFYMFTFFSVQGSCIQRNYFYLVWKLTGVAWKFNSVQYANMTVRRCERLKICDAGAEGQKTLICMTGGIYMFFACSVLVIKTCVVLPKINCTASSWALLRIRFHVNVVWISRCWIDTTSRSW